MWTAHALVYHWVKAGLNHPTQAQEQQLSHSVRADGCIDYCEGP